MRPPRLWWVALGVVVLVGLWAYHDLKRRAEYGAYAYEFLTRPIEMDGEKSTIGDELIRVITEQDGR
jgi:hypothetical protein